MKDIDLVKQMRGYAEAAEKNGFKVLTVPLRDLFPLIERLEAQGIEVDKSNALIDSLRVERNFLQRLAGERGNKLDEMERERDGLQKQIGELDGNLRRELIYVRDLNARAMKAEAELARRDAAAGEPVAWRYRFTGKPGSGPFTSEWKIVSTEDECNPSDCFERQALYTAAQPAVLPPVNDLENQNFRDAMQGIAHIRRTLEETFGGLHGTHIQPDVLLDCKEVCDAIYVAYRNAVQEKALGCQSEKVVMLPEAYAVKSEHGDLAYYPGDDGDNLDKSEVISAIEAAGVKWEESHE